MALTEEQLRKMDEVTGLGKVSSVSRILELQNLPTKEQLKPKKQSWLSKAAEFITGGKAGQDIAQAGYLMFGGQKKIDKITQQYLDNGNKLAELAKNQTDPDLKQKYASMAVQSFKEVKNVGGNIIGDTRTPEQIVGDFVGLATSVVAAGELPGVVKGATKATGFLRGASQGAKVGAKTGAIFGATGGVASGLQQNQGVGGVIKSGVLGSAAGAAGGAVVGGVTGGISGAIRGKSIKEQEFVSNLVMEKPTTKVKEAAIKRGSKGVTEQGLFRTAKIKPTARDLRTASDVKDLVSSKKTLLQNLDSIESKVDEIDNYVKSYAETHKVPFNTNQLRTRLNSGRNELNLVFASDSNAEKTYNALVDTFMDSIEKKNTPGLIDARQSFDKIPAVKKLLDSSPIGENARKEIVLTIRDKANQYVADLLPSDNQYRKLLYKESNMLNAIKNIAQKNTNIIGESKLTSLSKKYPIIATAIGTAAVTLLGLKGLGVKKSIVGSSD